MEEVVDNKKKTIITIVGVLMIFTLTLGISFAYFSSRSTSNTQTVKAGNLSLIFDDLTPIVNAENIVPLSEENILSKAVKKTFSITNDGNDIQYVDINLIDIATEELKVYDFKWALYEGDKKITTGNFASIDTETSINLTNNVKYTTNQTRTYNLYIWIQDMEKAQDELQGKTFSAKIQAKGNAKKANTLAKAILGENNSNVLSGEYNFETDYTLDEETSTYTANYTSGLYEQKDDSTKSNYGFSTYYYRGAVENNYVQLGTYKEDITNKVYDGITGDEDGVNNYTNTVVGHSGDPIIWRIVRINEDGSIKLIEENAVGLPTSTSTTYEEGLYTRQAVEDWYNTNLAVDSSVTNKIQIGDFCNDKYTNASKRITTSLTPIFTCPNDGNMLNLKVGLLTADEVVYSGALRQKKVSNTITYLNNNVFFWTLTPSTSTYVFYWNVYSKYLRNNDQSSASFSAGRAVINLKSDVTVKSGSGTSTEPYVLN